MTEKIDLNRLQIEVPLDGDEDELKSMWCDLYEGDEEYRDFFFEHYYCKDRCCIIRSATGRIMCYANYKYGRIVTGTNEVQAAYYYGGGTRLEYRNQGIFRAFGSLVYADMKKRGIPVYVFSADEGLEDMYDRMGCRRCSTLRLTTIGRITDYVARGIKAEITSSQYLIQKRCEFLKGIDNALIWNDDVMEFIYKLFMNDGGIFAVTAAGEDYYAVVTNETDKIFIHETSLPADFISEFADWLRQYYQTDKIVTIYSHESIIYGEYESEVIYYGHSVLVDKTCDREIIKNIYINLIEE